MNWEQFQIWHNYLLNTEHKDDLINKAIGKFSLVLADHKNGFSNFDQNKEDLTKKEWDLYGKINNILNKINIKYKLKLNLPRKCHQNSQKYQRKTDIKTGMMYNMPANINGLDTNDNSYFYIPIHTTRRHVHGVPNEFIESYIINMIDTAVWEKIDYTNYYSLQNKDRLNNINNCAIYECPEKYCIKNKTEKLIKCTKKINVFSKIIELKKFVTEEIFKKTIKYFYKKLVDNFRINFPHKNKYVTYCAGNCIYSDGFIHNGIPNGKQKCYICKVIFCRECHKSPYHDGELCNFTEEIKFDNQDDYRKCPGCGIWIEKIEGCSHIKCSCGVHFCYDCRGVLCAKDPYYHICTMNNSDPHFRDFQMNHPSVQYEGEIACNCRNCIPS